MIKKIFYNSSLPRSGSTLIQNILAQNPLIHTTPTSGIFEMFAACRTIYSDSLEFKAQDAKQMDIGFRSLLLNGIYGFYQPLTNKPYVIDKCRGWNSEWDFLNAFDPNPKIISMIRDPRAIFASLEKKFRANPTIDHHLANWGNMTGTTVDGRISVWSSGPPVGPSMDRFYDLVVRKLDQHILFVKFENLCENPNNELQRIYQYLELPYYQHNYDHIEQYTHEDDKIYGVFGDHVIKSKLEIPKEDYIEILGVNGCNMITENYAWFYNHFEYI